jgi:hypothetical protein
LGVFTSDYIIKIAAHEGGSKNLEAVFNHHASLMSIGLSQNQIGVAHAGWQA